MKLFCYIYKDCSLLPHFLNHYESLGVTDYFFIINIRGNVGLREDVLSSSKGRNVYCEYIDEIFLSHEKDSQLEKLKNKFSDSSEWVFVLDLDEFIDLGVSVKKLLSYTEDRKCNVICGSFIDRISVDGDLSPILKTPNIFEQFPIGADLTKNVLFGWTHKIVLMKAGLPFLNCGHSLVGKSWDGRMHARIHHFKWHRNVIDRLEERVEVFKVRNMSWWVESVRFLNFFTEKKKIDISLPALNARRVKLQRCFFLKDYFYILDLIVKDFFFKSFLFLVTTLHKSTAFSVSEHFKKRVTVNTIGKS